MQNQLIKSIDEDPHTSELTSRILYSYKIAICNLSFICSESISEQHPDCCSDNTTLLLDK